MKCKSGKHEWIDPVSAGRCCDPDWRREFRLGDKVNELDPQGRTVTPVAGMLAGWIRVKKEVAA